MDWEEEEISQIHPEILLYKDNNGTQYLTQRYSDEPHVDMSFFKSELDFYDITLACALPTLKSICNVALPVLGLCFLFQYLHQKNIKSNSKHILSYMIGIVILFIYFQELIVLPIAFAGTAYVMAIMVFPYRTYIFSVVALSYLLVSEIMWDRTQWLRIRNVQMILVMKFISFLVDMDKNKYKFPTMNEFLGYFLCPSNSVFGPWISYDTYRNLFKPRAWSVRYFNMVFLSFFYALNFFVISMCYADWITPTHEISSAMLIYRKALEYRAGHYFITYLSESFALACGFGYYHRRHVKYWHLSVSKPIRVELPHSLAQAVIYWNIPMHAWFREYVFMPLKKKMKTFHAIMITYLVSSMLHGMDAQLSVILLCLGFYTFAENSFRVSLAGVFNACILPKRCPPGCKQHKYTEKRWMVFFGNLFLSFLALYHLSYLGYLMDIPQAANESYFFAFFKWFKIGGYSHIVAFLEFFLSCVIY